MKKYAYIIIGIILCIIEGCFISFNHSITPVEKIIYVPVKDTISEKSNIARIVELEMCIRDSANTITNHTNPAIACGSLPLATT